MTRSDDQTECMWNEDIDNQQQTPLTCDYTNLIKPKISDSSWLCKTALSWTHLTFYPLFFRTTFFSTNKLFFVFICIFLVNVVSILDFVKYLPLTKEPKKRDNSERKIVDCATRAMKTIHKTLQFRSRFFFRFVYVFCAALSWLNSAIGPTNKPPISASVLLWMGMVVGILHC